MFVYELKVKYQGIEKFTYAHRRWLMSVFIT